MNKIIGVLSALFFFGLVLFTVGLFYWIEPCLFYTLMGMLVIWIIPGKTPLQIYCANVWLLLDQAWQVIYAPLLNLVMGPGGHAMFGHPDETASSVVGKNRHKTLGFKYVDKVLTFFDTSTKGSHGINSMELDRGSNFK